MKVKNFLMIFAIVLIAMFFSSCGTVGPTDPDDPFLPKDKTIGVQYIRVEPYDPSIGNVVTLRWNYTNYVGAQRMSPNASDENKFTCGAQIKTETKIGMFVEDWRKAYQGYNVRKRLFVDNHEFIFDGPVEGGIEFVYHNDGTIELTKY